MLSVDMRYEVMATGLSHTFEPELMGPIRGAMLHPVLAARSRTGKHVLENRSCHHRSLPTALDATPQIGTDRQTASAANRAHSAASAAQTGSPDTSLRR